MIQNTFASNIKKAVINRPFHLVSSGNYSLSPSLSVSLSVGTSEEVLSVSDDSIDSPEVSSVPSGIPGEIFEKLE